MIIGNKSASNLVSGGYGQPGERCKFGQGLGFRICEMHVIPQIMENQMDIFELNATRACSEHGGHLPSASNAKEHGE